MKTLILLTSIVSISFACKNETSFKDTTQGSRDFTNADDAGVIPSTGFIDPSTGLLPSGLINDQGTLVVPSSGLPNAGFDFPSLSDILGGLTPSTPGSFNPTSIGPTFTQPPASAITKGSFTVWANPQNPRPMQSYLIHIQVNLPSTINPASYNVRDLSGCVIGTDEYLFVLNQGQRGQTPISNCASAPSSGYTMGFFQQAFTSIFGKAQLIIRIPGAVQLVQDRITVSSSLLQESQTVSLIFN